MRRPRRGGKQSSIGGTAGVSTARLAHFGPRGSQGRSRILASAINNKRGEDMNGCRRRFHDAFFVLAACASVPAWSADAGSAGAAQTYPDRPIRWIVPAPPGG